jgi:hypothetical protein
MEALVSPHDLPNDDTLHTVPEVVQCTCSGEVTHVLQDSPPRIVYDPSVTTKHDDVAHAWEHPTLATAPERYRGVNNTRPRLLPGVGRTTVYPNSFSSAP